MHRIALAGALLACSALPLAAADPVSVSLDWTPNTNHIGLYVAAAQGFYEEAGLEVTIKPFDAAEPEADFDVASVLSLFTGRAAGQDLLGVLAVIQTETGRLVFRGDRDDIASPRDLSGLVYGGFGTAWEKTLVDTMIAHDGGEPRYESVILHSGVYEALDRGEVDFTLDIATWQGVRKELDGIAQGAFRYADYGVPDQHTIVITTRESFAEAHPGVVQAFVAATQRGYAFAVENPAAASAILIEAAPELVAEAALVRASLETMIAGHYLATPAGEVGRFDPAKMEALGQFLFATGGLADADGRPLDEVPDFSAYFTNDYLGR